MRLYHLGAAVASASLLIAGLATAAPAHAESTVSVTITPKITLHVAHTSGLSGEEQFVYAEVTYTDPEAGGVDYVEAGGSELQALLGGTKAWRNAGAGNDSGAPEYPAASRLTQNLYYRVAYKGGTETDAYYNGSTDTDYTYVFRPVTSAAVKVSVERAFKDSVKKKGKGSKTSFTFKGKISGWSKKKVVFQISKKAKKGYHTFKKVKSSKSGTFKVKLKVPKKGRLYYRFKVPGSAAYKAGYSAVYYIYRY